MRYVGRTKVGKIKPNPTTELAIVRLPVDMKEKAGKWAHIWKVDENTIMIRFSESKEVDKDVGAYFGVQMSAGRDIEKRVEELERAIEEIKSMLIENKTHDETKTDKKMCSGRDLNPGHGIESPV